LLRTSSAGTLSVLRKPRHITSENGFTLVELMMVLVIIGLMSSAVVMTFPKDPPASRAISEQLVTRLNQSAQNSLLSAAPSAFGISKSAYSFFSYDGTEWIAATSKDWPKELTLELRKEGSAVKLADDPVPLILFEPTGTSSVFTLTISDFDGRYVLSSKGDGRVTLESGS